MFAYLVFTSTLQPVILTGLALLCSGGLSNLLDRILNQGMVVDFLNLGVGSFRTGIFNIADMAILAGTLCVVIAQSRRASQ